MESNISNKNLSAHFIPLLPNYFKKIGISILILAFLPAIIFRLSRIELNGMEKGTLKYLSINVFILGMLLIAWAKNKVENEFTLAIRIKSIGIALVLTVFGVVFKPLSDLILGLKIADMTAQDVIIGMLFTYFVFFSLQKK